MTIFRILIAPWEKDDVPGLVQAANVVRNALRAYDPTPLPPPQWKFDSHRTRATLPQTPPAPLLSIRITVGNAPGEAQRLSESLRSARDQARKSSYDLQTDSPLRSTYAAPGNPFGFHHEALALIGAVPPLGKLPVHVVIVDQGFDASVLDPKNFGGGWFRADGSTPLPGHGKSQHAAMIARAVLSVAPDAVLFDAPLIPTPPPGALPTINDIPTFAGDAGWLWRSIDHVLEHHGNEASWVFVNAWSIYDRTSDLASLTQYTTDPRHDLNLTIDRIVRHRNADVVFAAGNCGQFDPDRRCGRYDRGSCHSIWGANSLDSVLTVGAVRTDRNWLGFSSQGDGQPNLGLDKPDLCAPAEFADESDAHRVYGGTSAACGLAGGVVAALRAQRSQTALHPITLIGRLKASATPPRPNEHRTRLGAGIINLERTQPGI